MSVDAATTPPTNPGPLSRLPRDPVQICLSFLARDDLATTHRVSRLWRAAHDAERSRRKLFAQQLPRMLQRLTVELHSEDDRVVVAAAKELRELLCLDSPPIAQVLRTKGVLERLIALLQRDHPTLQRESVGGQCTLWGKEQQRALGRPLVSMILILCVAPSPVLCVQLTNLVAGATEQSGQVIRAGVLPILVRMLLDHRANYREGQEHAVRAVSATLSGRGDRTVDASILTLPAVCVLRYGSDRPHRRSFSRPGTGVRCPARSFHVAVV